MSNKVISRNNVQSEFPLQIAIIAWLALDHANADTLVRSLVWILVALDVAIWVLDLKLAKDIDDLIKAKE